MDSFQASDTNSSSSNNMINLSNSCCSSSNPSSPLSRYENQKRRDWNTFIQYLRNHRPPLSLPRCDGTHVLDFLRYLDQFGKTKVHTKMCPFYGHPDPPGPCPCPRRQAWGSLDSLIGRLRAAFEENGEMPEANPFGAAAVMLYLREVRDSQAKARGISYDKKKRKSAAPPPPSAKTHIKSLVEGAHDWKLLTPCRPMPQAINQATPPLVEEDIELAKAIDASIQSALQERPPLSDPLQIYETNASNSSSTSMDSEELSQHEISPGGDLHSDSEIKRISIIQTSTTSDSIRSSPTPSAPPVSDDCLDDPFHLRSIESTPVQKGESSSCVICMDAAVEGAFVPCGHMAGCMACLNDIKDKNWDCPVCRAKVDQVLRLFAV